MIGRVRVELWDDLPAAGGVRRAFLSSEETVVEVETPDALDYSSQAHFAFVPSMALVAALKLYPTPIWRLEPLNDDGTAASDPVEHWRGLAHEFTRGAGVTQLTVTAEHPLRDWDKVGRCRVTTSGGLTTYNLSGEYDPSTAIGIALGRMNDAGRGYWQPGFIDRTDIKNIQIVGVTPLELLKAIESKWESEAEADHTSGESIHRVHLRSRIGAGLAVPTLRYDEDGALLGYTQRADAATLAQAVTPIGADRATLARAGWSVELVDGGLLSIYLADPSGGAGAVQLDGQFVGNYVRASNGVLHEILDSFRGDGFTSQIVMASVADFTLTTPRQHVEIAADSAGTLLTTVIDPAVALTQRVEATLDRSDLTADRNLNPNARGEHYTGTTVSGWTSTGSVTLSRGTPPAGCPIGDDGTGQMWHAIITSGSTLKLTPSNVLDNPPGDDSVVASAWIYLVSGDDLSVGFDGFGVAAVLPAANTGVWEHLDAVASLPGAQSTRVALIPDPLGAAGGVDIWFAASMIQRTAVASPPWTEYEQPRVNVIHQAANAYLLGHHTVPRTLPSARVDESRLTVPLARGIDVRAVDAAYGVNVIARYVGRQRARHTQEPSDLTLVEAPDPIVAQLTGSASPGRRLRFTEQIARDLGSGGGNGNGASSTSVSGGGTVLIRTNGLTRVDPEYYNGADPTGATDNTAILQNILSTYRELRIRRGATFLTQRLQVIGSGALDPSQAVHIWGAGTLKLANAQDTELLWLQDCYWSILEGIILHANGANQTPNAAVNLLLRNMAYTRLSGVRTLYSCAHGIAVENYDAVSASSMADELNFTDVFSLFNNGDGLIGRQINPAGQGPGDLTLQGCHFNANGRHGLNLGAGSFNKVLGGEFLSNLGAGIVMSFGIGQVLTGLTARNNGDEGIWIQNTAKTRLNGVTSHFNNLNAGTATGILIDTTTDTLIANSDVHDQGFTTRTYRPLKAISATGLDLRSSRFYIGTQTTGGTGTSHLDLDATTLANYTAQDCIGIANH